MGTIGTPLFGSGLFGGPITAPAPPPSGVLVSNIIYHAYRSLSQLSEPGRLYSAEELVDGIAALNFMVDSWNIERLMIPALDRLPFPAVAGQGDYQISLSAADFMSRRPSRLEYASVVISTGFDSPFEWPLHILTPGQYQQIPKKNIQDVLPRAVYYDKRIPDAHLLLWPVPSIAMQLVLYVWVVLPAFATVNDLVLLAPGYFRALYLNLAVELAARYPKRIQISPFTVALAKEAKSAVMALNSDLFPGEVPAKVAA